MKTQLRCKCGLVQAEVDLRHIYGRAVCYCTDCRAFTVFLGASGDVLDEKGGTDILAILPAAVDFTAGADQLACMSLSEKGMLRWYAVCCRTPLGNTPRNQKMSYVGLMSKFMPSLDDAVAPPTIAVNTDHALAAVRPTPMASILGVMRIMRHVIGARLSGKYRNNPFFRGESGVPVAAPKVLTRRERHALDNEF